MYVGRVGLNISISQIKWDIIKLLHPDLEAIISMDSKESVKKPFNAYKTKAMSSQSLMPELLHKPKNEADPVEIRNDNRLSFHYQDEPIYK